MGPRRGEFKVPVRDECPPPHLHLVRDGWAHAAAHFNPSSEMGQPRHVPLLRNRRARSAATFNPLSKTGEPMHVPLVTCWWARASTCPRNLKKAVPLSPFVCFSLMRHQLVNYANWLKRAAPFSPFKGFLACGVHAASSPKVSVSERGIWIFYLSRERGGVLPPSAAKKISLRPHFHNTPSALYHDCVSKYAECSFNLRLTNSSCLEMLSQSSGS